jgi:putative ABC transport system substrate-binding protein
MRRRDFIRITVGTAVVWPLAAQGQKPDRMRRVSVLIGTPENDPETKSRIRAFRLGLRDAGWAEGRNIQIEFWFPGTDHDAISKQVSEAIRSAPDVILANSTPVMAALRPATNSIPVVFVLVNDPVGQGFVSNLTRPGSNVTGFSFIDPEIVGKWIDLLTDVKPDLAQLVLLFNPDTAPYYDSYLHSFKALPQRSRVGVDAAHVRSEAEIEQTIARLAREPRAGLVVAADPYTVSMRATILKLADQHRVPLIAPYRFFVVAGGLISYGPDTTDIFRRSSAYVDRILGIAHGFATLGTIGFEGRFDYAAIGTVANVASRLCDEAKPGQILISPRVLMAVERDVTVEPVGDFALKGIRRPLTAYNVLATKAAD